jgi:hypothetical protein
MSPEFVEQNPDKNKGKRALILIQGSGGVRAGIWSRSACINESVQVGSMLPLIDRCVSKGIAVLVMNPNQWTDEATGKKIPLSSTMREHSLNVWKHIVDKSGFDQLDVIAHSAGGACLTTIQ